MWHQFWVASALDEELARRQVQAAINEWTPDHQEAPQIESVRIYRGPDDLALAEEIAQDLSAIRQTVAQSHRQELSRRLASLRHRPIGIPPKEGWVVLDGTTPRSPRPLDCRGQSMPRWVVTVAWPGTVPSLPIE